MNIEPIYEEIGLKTELKKQLCENKIECNTGIPVEEAAKILAISSHVTLTGEEVADAQFSCGGRVIFCMAYEDAEGNLKKAERGAEFSTRIAVEGVTPSCTPHTTLKVQKATADKSGANVIINAVVSSETKFTSSETAKALSGGDGLILRRCDKKIIKETPVKKAVYPVEDEFELGYGVGEVLLHTATATVTAAQCGVGTLILDGDIILSLCLLQKIENSDILKETRKISFRLETEAEDAMPACPATAEVSVKAVKLNVLVDEATGKSTVTANISVEVGGAYYEESERSLVTDAYSQACEIKADKNEYCFSVPVAEKTSDIRVQTRGVFADRLEAGARLMCCALENVTLTNVRAETGLIAVEGVIEAVAMLKDVEGKIFTAQLEAPFNTNIDFEVGDAEYSLTAALTDFSARIVSLEAFEIDAVITFRVKTSANEKLTVLTSVETGEEKKPNTSAISVYIPIEGEDLWEVAKRLNTCPETITALNGDLAYPLTGEERIVIYRQEAKEY